MPEIVPLHKMPAMYGRATTAFAVSNQKCSVDVEDKGKGRVRPAKRAAMRQNVYANLQKCRATK